MAKDQAAQERKEMVGLLTAISIVSRRLAENLKKIDEEAADNAK